MKRISPVRETRFIQSFRTRNGGELTGFPDDVTNQQNLHGRTIASILVCQFREARFADNGYFDLAGIGQLLFKGLGNIPADSSCLGVVGISCTGNDSKLASSTWRKPG